jgi:hypothetical protein
MFIVGVIIALMQLPSHNSFSGFEGFSFTNFTLMTFPHAGHRARPDHLRDGPNRELTFFSVESLV